MSQSMQQVQKSVALKPRVARRIIRNYLRISFISQVEPTALTKTALERAEAQLNRVPGYKLVKPTTTKLAKVTKRVIDRSKDDRHILAEFFPAGVTKKAVK